MSIESTVLHVQICTCYLFLFTCNHQADSPLYVWSDVCSGYLQVEKKYGHTWHWMSLLGPGVFKQHKPNQTFLFWPECLASCAQRFPKLIYLHLFTDCFMKISLQLLEQTLLFNVHILCLQRIQLCCTETRMYLSGWTACLCTHCKVGCGWQVLSWYTYVTLLHKDIRS